MSNEESFTFICIFVILVLLGISATPDVIHINLDEIKKAQSVCESHGSLKYIEHDYDYECMDGLQVNAKR